MALNFPSTPSTNQTYVDGNGVVWIYDGAKWSVNLGTINKLFSGAKVSLAVALSLTNTPVPVDYDNEDIDVGDYYSFTNAERLTINSTGYYRIAGTFYTGAAGNGNSYVFSLIKNGTQTVTTQTCAANQSANYDAVVFLSSGDYISINASETGSVGTLLANSYVEIQKLGHAPGVGVGSYNNFSGVRSILSSNALLSSTPTGVSWTSTDYDVNADILGNVYWSAMSPTRFTVRTTGYYQLRGFLSVSASGAENSYILTLKKNGTTNITSTTLSPNDSANIDEMYRFTANDYIELIASNSGAVGSVLSGSYIELIRIGV